MTTATATATTTATTHYTDDPGHLTEFVGGYHGTCGQCALEDARASLELERESFAQLSDELIAITHEMQQHGQAAPNGSTSLWALAREAERLGLKILLEWDYASPFNHDWHSILLANAGKHPIILFFENGQALRDIETGAHDEIGLHGHFIVVLDKQTDGYRTNDGDNPQVMSRYAIYSYDTLNKAQVMGLLMLDGGTSTMATTTTPHVPAGWRDDGKTLVAPNGVPVIRGFRSYVLAYPGGWQANNTPLKPEAFCAQIEPGNAAMGKGARQDFRYSSLGCQQHADGSWGNPYVIAVGQDLVAIESQLAAALAHVSQLEAQLAAQQSQQPAPTPAPTPAPDPKATEALAALVELAKALKLVTLV